MDIQTQLLSEKDKKQSKSFQIFGTDKNDTYTYSQLTPIGSGSFGTVFRAVCDQTGTIVAIKKVFQDTRYKNRELQILKELHHPNVIQIINSFFTPGERGDDLYLNVVMDYIPDTLSQLIRKNNKTHTDFSLQQIKLFAYQMIRGINYLKAIGICHRDIKPHNILIDTSHNLLKICDFGSAKKLVKGDTNISYICSRYYRAPELIFGSTEYDYSIDVWSVGCVVAELVLSEPIFPGENSSDQLVEIIKILGTPSRRQIKEMNPKYEEYKFPIIRSFSLSQVFKKKMNLVGKDFIDLLSKILVYEPSKRISPLEALMHPFFNDIRDENSVADITIPDNLFQFSPEEVAQDTRKCIQYLVPDWYCSNGII